MTNHFHFKYFSRNNMKRQLITLFICAILIPVVCIGAVLGLFTYRRTTVHYEDLAYSQSKVVHSTIVSTSIYLHSTYETVVNRLPPAGTVMYGRPRLRFHGGYGRA